MMYVKSLLMTYSFRPHPAQKHHPMSLTKAIITLEPYKMVEILQTTTEDAFFFLNWNIWISNTIQLKCISDGATDNKSTPV